MFKPNPLQKLYPHLNLPSVPVKSALKQAPKITETENPVVNIRGRTETPSVNPRSRSSLGLSLERVVERQRSLSKPRVKVAENAEVLEEGKKGFVEIPPEVEAKHEEERKEILSEVTKRRNAPARQARIPITKTGCDPKEKIPLKQYLNATADEATRAKKVAPKKGQSGLQAKYTKEEKRDLYLERLSRKSIKKADDEIQQVQHLLEEKGHDPEKLKEEERGIKQRLKLINAAKFFTDDAKGETAFAPAKDEQPSNIENEEDSS